MSLTVRGLRHAVHQIRIGPARAAPLILALTLAAACGSTPPPAPTSPPPAAKPIATTGATGAGGAQPTVAGGAVASPAVKPTVSTAPSPAAAAKPSAPSKPLTKVVVNTSGSSLLYSNLYIAKYRGFFEQEGLDADLIELAGAPQATQAVLAGSSLLAVTPINAAIDAVQRNQPIVVVGAGVNQNANIIVMAKDWAERNRVTAQSPLTDRIKALKGAKVAVVGPRAANDDLLRFMLVTYGGLSPDRDVEIVNLGASPSYPPALEAKRIDAFVGASPAAETSIVRGQGISLANLMTGEAPELRGQLFVASIVRRDSIERQRDQVAAAMRALARAQKLIGDRPDEAKRVLRENKFDAIAPDVWELAWQNNLPGLATSPLLDEKGYQINFALLDKAREDKTPEIPFARISDNSLAQEAVRAVAQ